jgi:uncharacterized membrane protein YGL010W
MFIRVENRGRYSMKSFIEQASAYAQYHQNPIAQYIRVIATPLIVLSMLILLSFVHIVIIGILNITLSEIATLCMLIYYFFLNWRLALVATPLFIFLLWVATLLSGDGPDAFALWAFLVTFVLGCIAQFVAYFIEGKRPLGMDLLRQALIAPLFLIAELFFAMGRMQDLKQRVYESTEDNH